MPKERVFIPQSKAAKEVTFEEVKLPRGAVPIQDDEYVTEPMFGRGE